MVADSRAYTVAKKATVPLRQLHFALTPYCSWLKDVSAAAYDKANLFVCTSQAAGHYFPAFSLGYSKPKLSGKPSQEEIQNSSYLGYKQNDF